MFIQLRNETGNLRIVKIGFSWTMLFFWFFAPMLRGDWLHMILSLVLGYLTKGLSLFIYPIVYNRLYIMGLLATGWGPARAEDREMLELKGFRVKASYAYREKTARKRSQRPAWLRTSGHWRSRSSLGRRYGL